jgi:hypothetical protein
MADISLSMRESVSRKRWSVIRSRAGGLGDEAVQMGCDGIDVVARLTQFVRQVVDLALGVAPHGASFLAFHGVFQYSGGGVAAKATA